MRTGFLCLMWVVLGTGLAWAGGRPLPEDEAAVIRDALRQAYPSARYALREETTMQAVRQAFPGEISAAALAEYVWPGDEAAREAVEDFLLKNAHPTKLVLAQPGDIGLVSAVEERLRWKIPRPPELLGVGPHLFPTQPWAGLLAAPEAWEVFYGAYPETTGLMELSRPGLNRQETVAVIYLGRQSGVLDGSGDLYLLRRVGGKWVLDGTSFNLWLS